MTSRGGQARAEARKRSRSDAGPDAWAVAASGSTTSLGRSRARSTELARCHARHAGSLCVLGPVRMDYDKVVPLVAFTATVLGGGRGPSARPS